MLSQVTEQLVVLLRGILIGFLVKGDPSSITHGVIISHVLNIVDGVNTRRIVSVGDPNQIHLRYSLE